MAERQFVNPATAPSGLPILRNDGYDGQFYYRLALDPMNLHLVAFGITLDAPFRLQRIGYPVLAWVLASGHRAWIPTTLVIVNVAAIGALAWFGAVAARDGGRHCLWGLLLAGYFGFAFSVARDTAEPVAAAFMVGGLLAYRYRRFVPAALLLAAGCLTRETVLVAVVAIALSRLVTMLRCRRCPGRPDVAWVVPATLFGGWQAVVRTVDGVWPMSSDAHDNLTIPFEGLVDGLRSHLSALSSSPFSSRAAPNDAWVVEVLVFAVIVGFALASLHKTAAPAQERLALVLFVLDLCVLSRDVWSGVVDLRSLDEVYVMAILVLLGLPSRRKELWHRVGPERVLALVGTLVALTMAVVVTHRIIAL